MFQLKLKRKIEGRVRLRCSKHPQYNPEKGGRDAIVGACSECHHIHDAYVQICTARAHLEEAIRNFTRSIEPYHVPVTGRNNAVPQATPISAPSCG